MRALHGLYEGAQGLLQRRVLHVRQDAHWRALQQNKLRGDEIPGRLSERELEGCGGRGGVLRWEDEM